MFLRLTANEVLIKGGVLRPKRERDAGGMAATMDHSDIRGLGTAFHLFLAGLPRSSSLSDLTGSDTMERTQFSLRRAVDEQLSTD